MATKPGSKSGLGKGPISAVRQAEYPIGDKRASAPQNTSVGSGSRPTRSKHVLEDSSPVGTYEIRGRKPIGGGVLR